MVVAACGGGGVSTTPVPAPAITAPAVPALTAFSSVTTSVAVAPTSSSTLPTLTPPAGVDPGTTANIVVPAQAAGGVAATAQASMSSSAPAGLPVLQNIGRTAQGTRAPADESSPISGILYFAFELSAPPPVTSFTLSAAPTFTITLPSAYFNLPSTSYYLALYDPTKPSLAWQSRAEVCTAIASTTTLVCNAPPPGGPVTITNNVTYVLALYAVSTAAASPTPAPSVTPTTIATNSPLPTASPSPGASAAVSATLISSAQTIPLPAVGGVSGSVSLMGSSGGTVSGTAQTSPGNGFAPVSGTPVYSVSFTANSTIYMSPATATFTLPAAPATGTRFLIATYDSRYGWYYGYAGPGTVSGSTVSFAPPQSINLVAGVTFGVALYSLPSTGVATGNVSITSGGTLTLPAASGASGSIVLGTVSAPTTASVSLFFDPPGGVPNPGTEYPAALFYEFTPAASVTITGTTTGTFNPPSTFNQNNGSGTRPYVEVYDTSNPTRGWYYQAAGPGSQGNPAVVSTSQTIVLTGGVTYVFGVYPQ